MMVVAYMLESRRIQYLNHDGQAVQDDLPIVPMEA